MPSMTQIKASAGSGKTWTLTQKFLAHLAALSPGAARSGACTLHGPEEDWRSVMAITFTNAAATEMQERVLKVLKERALISTQNRLRASPQGTPESGLSASCTTGQASTFPPSTVF